MLDLSKREAGKMELKPPSLDLAGVLRDGVRMVAGQCAEAGLERVVPGLDHELPVFGEAAKGRQIFLDPPSNAAKFTEAGESLVELHGGSLHSESAAGPDTRATARLARHALADAAVVWPRALQLTDMCCSAAFRSWRLGNK